MAALLLIARLLLAGLFGVAGGAKLADRDGTRVALEEFGLKRFLSPAALLLPLAELSVAALLLPAVTARWGGVLALALLSVFSIAIAGALRRGETPDCHCFGQLRSAPTGRVTLVRNAVLAALAAFVVVAGWGDGGASSVRWLGDLSSAGVVALVGGVVLVLLCAVGGALFLTLLRQHGRLLLRVEELEAGLSHELVVSDGPARGLVFPDLDGRRVDLDALEGEETLLLFWNPDCGYCDRALPDLREWEEAAEGARRLLVVSSGSAPANRALGLRAPILLDPGFIAPPAFGASGTPSAVLLDERGRIASEVAAGADEVLDLLGARPRAEVALGS
ncbi:MAG: TlpA family protein disulfide reductase [Solirubrobacteraceae bacterium]